MITQEDMTEIRKSLDAVLKRMDDSVKGSTDRSYVKWYTKHRTRMEDLRNIIGGKRRR